MMDEQGNLWVLNATTLGRAVHILTPLGQWVSLPLISVGNELSFETPAGIWVDRRHSNWKWLVGQRGEPQLVLLDDGGTPTYNGDDKCRARNTFVDQNSRVITLAEAGRTKEVLTTIIEADFDFNGDESYE